MVSRQVVDKIERCSGCGGEIRVIDNEMVCVKCGEVKGEVFNALDKIPMGETRSPTCSLDVKDSLGSVLSPKDQFRITYEERELKEVVCPKCKFHFLPNGMGSPLYQIRASTERVKHPIIDQMDRYGHTLLDRFLNRNIAGGRDSNTSKIFANMLAKAINRVGEPLVRINDGRGLRKRTEACFYYVWVRLGLPNENEIRWALWPKTGGIPEVREVWRILSQK